MRLFLSCIMIFLVCGRASSQTKYSYTDPCTGNIKTIQFDGNTIPITYYGQIKSFTPDELRLGDFERWAQGISQTFGNSNPCGSIVGIPTAIDVTQSISINFMSVLNSLSALSDMSEDGMTNIVSNAVGSAQNSKKKEGKKNKDGNSMIPSSSTPVGQSGTNPTAVGNSSSKSGQNSGRVGQSIPSSNQDPSRSSESNLVESNPVGSLSPETVGSGSGNPSVSSEMDSKSEGRVNVIGSAVNTLSNSPAGSKNGNRPTILATSDFVGFNFSKSDITFGGKVSGGYTAMRWDGLRASGILGDYTSAINGPNVSCFYANMAKSRIDISSVSLTASFQRKFSIYGSVSVGQMWTLKIPKKMKIVYMLVGSYGSVYGKTFIGTAAIVGGMYDWKVSKRIDIKIMGLYVYAPYVNYQTDILLKSPHVILPILGTNFGITKRFRFNINAGGAWAINENNLNYTVMMGTRLLL